MTDRPGSAALVEAAVTTSVRDAASDPERRRIAEGTADQPGPWWAFGPYLSERAWGTVREDYSADGRAWDYFPHDHARSRAYRWSEDGLAGMCDAEQRLCFALAFWFPLNYLVIGTLRRLHAGLGDAFTVELPTGSGRLAHLGTVADDLERRLRRLFLRDGTGRRPIWGSCALFQEDPAWRDELLFHEYFHGETGEGLGASHQTGWTALAAALIAERSTATTHGAASRLARGAYALADPPRGEPEIILMATGTRCRSVAAYEELSADGLKARVVGMPSWGPFRAAAGGVSGERPAADDHGARRRRGGVDVRLGGVRRDAR